MSKGHALGMRNGLYGPRDVAEIVEWLTLPHEHEIRHDLPDPLGKGKVLLQDFGDREVCGKLLRAGVAKRAAERTADLATDTERGPIMLRDQHRFHNL